MRLFDENGNMPSGVRMVIENLLKNVAPDMAKDLDVICGTVASFKAQMDRIEANQALILRAINIPQPEHDNERLGRRAGSNQLAPNCAGKQTGG